MPIIIGRGKREHELAIRIYQLAKQLKIDNKALVDFCKKLGFAGKGSALASLSDDQVAAIQDFMAGGKKPAAPPEPETAAVPKREEKTLGRVRTLPPTTTRAVPEAPPQEPEPVVAAPVPTPVVTPVPTPVVTPVPTPVVTPVPTPVVTPVPTPVVTPVPTPVVTPVPTPVVTPVPTPVVTPVPTPVVTPVPTPVAESPSVPVVTPTASQVPEGPPNVTPTPPSRPLGAVRREDYIGPAGAADKKIPTLGSGPSAAKKQGDNADRASGPAGKSGPSIKLAPMPTVKAPPPKKQQEQRAQKPDLKLPPGRSRLADQARSHFPTIYGNMRSARGLPVQLAPKRQLPVVPTMRKIGTRRAASESPASPKPAGHSDASSGNSNGNGRQSDAAAAMTRTDRPRARFDVCVARATRVQPRPARARSCSTCLAR